MIRWNRIRALTFDCFGTLIDRQSGLRRDLRRGLGGDPAILDEDLLHLYEAAEDAARDGPFRPYPEIVRDALLRVGAAAGLPVSDPDALARGAGTWPPFPDAAESLKRLQGRYRLCALIDVNRETALEIERALAFRFDAIITASDVHAYRPSPARLIEALHRLGLAPDEVVHAGASHHADLAPAAQLGLHVAWIDRRTERQRRPEPASSLTPDVHVSSLSELCRRAATRPSRAVPATEPKAGAPPIARPRARR